MKETLSVELATKSKAIIWTETVLLALINVAALLGNLITCYAVYRNQRLRTIPNMFVVALGVSDILMSTCCMPFSVATLLHRSWLFGERFCRFQGYESLTFGMASLHTMGIIAVSRYFCVVKPAKYTVLFNKHKPLMYIAFVWFVALVGSLPPFFFNNGGFEFQPGKAMCLYSFESSIAYTIFIEVVYITAPLIIITICYIKVFYTVSQSNHVFSHKNNPQQLRANVEEAKVTKTLAAVMAGFTCCWLPVCIITICYTKVFRTVSKSNQVFAQENNLQQLRTNVEEAKVTKTLAAVMAGFIFCWLPVCIMDYIDAARGKNTLPRQAYLTYGFLVHLSSSINPFIYAVTSKQFRREYKVVLGKILGFQCQNNINNNDRRNNTNNTNT